MQNTIELNGRTYRIDIQADDRMGAPWKEHDGHGIVSEWTSRNKDAGEWLLDSHRARKLFYDFAATMKKARAEGWGLSDEQATKLAIKLNKPILALTKGEITAESVRLDFEFLRRWCNNEWYWVGVIVTDITDDEDAPIDYSNALWGIGSDSQDYIQQVAQDLAGQAYHEYAKAHRFADAMANAL